MNYSLTNSDTIPVKAFDPAVYIREAQARRRRLLSPVRRVEAKDPVSVFYAPAFYREVVTPQSWSFLTPKARMRHLVEEELRGSDVTFREVCGPTQMQRVVDKRFDCIARIKQEMGCSDRVIASFFNRDRTTILNALKRRGVWKPRIAA